jgi:hypothetical protein
MSFLDTLTVLLQNGHNLERTVSMTLIIVIMFSLPNFIDEMKRKV